MLHTYSLYHKVVYTTATSPPCSAKSHTQSRHLSFLTQSYIMYYVYDSTLTMCLCFLTQSYIPTTSNFDVLRRVTKYWPLLTCAGLDVPDGLWPDLLWSLLHELHFHLLPVQTHTSCHWLLLVLLPLCGTHHLPRDDSAQQALCGLFPTEQFAGTAHFYTSRIKNFIHIWNNVEQWHLAL